MNKVHRAACSLLLISSPVLATDALYKCEDAKGAVSILSEPCPASSKQIWKRDPAAFQAPTTTMPTSSPRPPTAPASMTTPPPRAMEAAPRPATDDASPTVMADKPASVPDTPAPEDPCEKAQNFAADLRDKPWLQLTDEQMRRVYGWLSQQCRQSGSGRD